MTRMELKNRNIGRLMYRHHMKYNITNTKERLNISTMKCIQVSIGSFIVACHLHGYVVENLKYSMFLVNDFSQKAGAIVDILARAIYNKSYVFESDNYDIYAPYFHNNLDYKNNGMLALRVPGSTIGFIEIHDGVIVDAKAYTEHGMQIDVVELGRVMKFMIGSKVRFYEDKPKN